MILEVLQFALCGSVINLYPHSIRLDVIFELIDNFAFSVSQGFEVQQFHNGVISQLG